MEPEMLIIAEKTHLLGRNTNTHPLLAENYLRKKNSLLGTA